MKANPTSWLPVTSAKDLSRATLYIFCEESICIRCPLIIPYFIEFARALTDQELDEFSQAIGGVVIASSTQANMYYFYGDVEVEMFDRIGLFNMNSCPRALYLASQIFLIRYSYPDFDMYSTIEFKDLDIPNKFYSNCDNEYTTDISLIYPAEDKRKSKGKCLFWDIEVVSDQKKMCEACDINDKIYAISIAFEDRLIVIHTTSFPDSRISKEIFPIVEPQHEVEERLAEFMNSTLTFVSSEFNVASSTLRKEENLLRDIECIRCENELECIEQFVNCVQVFNPDYMCSYNGYGFDEDYLAQRMQRHYGYVPNLTRLKRPYEQFLTRTTLTPWNSREQKLYIPMFGRESIDMMKFYQLYIYSYRYKLDVIAKHYLNDTKLDMSISVANTAVLTANNTILRNVLQYSGKDCLLLQELEAKTHMMSKLKSFASKFGMTLTDLLSRPPDEVILLILASIDLQLSLSAPKPNKLNNLPIMKVGIYRNIHIVDISNLLIFLLYNSGQTYAKELALAIKDGPYLLKLAAFQCGYFNIEPMITRLNYYCQKVYGIFSSIAYISSLEKLPRNANILGSYRMIVFISNKSLIYLNDDNSYSYRGTSRLTYHRFPFIRHLIEFTLNSRASLPAVTPVMTPDNLWISEKIDLSRDKIDKEIQTDFSNNFGIVPVANYVQRYRKNSYRDLLMQRYSYLNEGYSHLVEYLVTVNGPVLRGIDNIDEEYYSRRINLVKSDLSKLMLIT